VVIQPGKEYAKLPLQATANKINGRLIWLFLRNHHSIHTPEGMSKISFQNKRFI
jgi:hypothetical protein